LRAVWVTHAAVGCAVAPRIRIRQRAEQRGEPCPVGWLELVPLPAELAVQHGELVP
jgi:hypothetical protein